MPFHCPECERIITNRKLPNCSWCSAELPTELLLTTEQIEKLEKQKEEEKKKHDLFMRKPSNIHSPGYGSSFTVDGFDLMGLD